MMKLDGRRKGRPKRRCTDSVNVDLREKGMSVDETTQPGCVEATCQKHRPHIEVEKVAVGGRRRRDILTGLVPSW